MTSVVNGMGTRLTTFEQQTKAIGMGLSTTLSLPILGLGVAATKMAVDFDKAMFAVNSVAKLSGGEFQKLKSDILEFSTTTSQSSGQVALAYRGIVARGFEAAGAMTILRSAVDAAGNMMSDTETTTNALTTVLKVYNLTASDSVHVMDVLESAATTSSLKFDELSASIGDSVAMAKATGVSFETTTAALMTMANAGFGAGEAATQLQSLLKGLLKPTDELQEMIQQWGYSTSEAALNALGFEGVLQKIYDTTSGSTEKITTLFGRIEATKGVLSLTANAGNNFAKSLDTISKASDGVGTHAEMIDIRHQSVAYQITRVKGLFETFAISLGNVVLPALGDLLDRLKGAAEWLNNLDESQRRNIMTFGAILAAIGPVTYAIGALIGAAKTVWVAISALPAILTAAGEGMQFLAAGESLAEVASLGLSAVLVPIIVVLGAIAVAVYAAKMAWDLYNTSQEKTREVSGKWTEYLDKQSKTQRDATSVADAYIAKQKEIGAIWDSSSLGVKLFTDRNKIANAGLEDLTTTIVKSATSYEDYVAAIDKINTANQRTVTTEEILSDGTIAYTTHVENLTEALSRGAFEMARTVDVNHEAALALRWTGEVAEMATPRVIEFGDKTGRAFRQSAVEEKILTADLEKLQEETKKAADEAAKARDTYASWADGQLSAVKAFTDMNKAYEERGRLQAQLGDLDAEVRKYTGLKDVTRAYTAVVGGATAAQREERQAILDKMTALDENFRKETAMQAVGSLTVEQFGTGEAAAQRYEIAKRNLMLATGLITPAALAEQDAINLMTGAYVTGQISADNYAAGLGSVRKAAEDGSVSLKELMDAQTALRDQANAAMKVGGSVATMGPQAATAAVPAGMAESPAATMQTAWNNLNTNLTTVTGPAITTAVSGIEMTTTTSMDAIRLRVEAASTSFTAMFVPAIELARVKGTAAAMMLCQQIILWFGLAQRAIEFVAAAIASIPDKKTIVVEVKYNAPPELQTQSPDFLFTHALQSAVSFAAANPITVSAEMRGGATSTPILPVSAGGPAPVVSSPSPQPARQGGGDIYVSVNVASLDGQTDIADAGYQLAREIKRRQEK